MTLTNYFTAHEEVKILERQAPEVPYKFRLMVSVTQHLQLKLLADSVGISRKSGKTAGKLKSADGVPTLWLLPLNPKS